MTTSKPLQFKLVLLGESAVGKSSLVLRYVNDTFDDNRESTIGAAFLTKTIRVDEDLIKFEIWDTAGQERYKSLAPMYYRSANAAIVVYSLNSLDSLQSARNWIKELKRQGEANTIIILVGNKSDLPELSKKVTQNDVQNLLTELEIKFHFECSAKTGLNVNQLFETIANNLPIKEIKELNKVNKQQQSLKLDQQSQTSSNQDNCAC